MLPSVKVGDVQKEGENLDFLEDLCIDDHASGVGPLDGEGTRKLLRSHPPSHALTPLSPSQHM